MRTLRGPYLARPRTLRTLARYRVDTGSLADRADVRDRNALDCGNLRRALTGVLANHSRPERRRRLWLPRLRVRVVPEELFAVLERALKVVPGSRRSYEMGYLVERRQTAQVWRRSRRWLRACRGVRGAAACFGENRTSRQQVSSASQQRTLPRSVIDGQPLKCQGGVRRALDLRRGGPVLRIRRAAPPG